MLEIITVEQNDMAAEQINQIQSNNLNLVTDPGEGLPLVGEQLADDSTLQHGEVFLRVTVSDVAQR